MNQSVYAAFIIKKSDNGLGFFTRDVKPRGQVKFVVEGNTDFIAEGPFECGGNGPPCSLPKGKPTIVLAPKEEGHYVFSVYTSDGTMCAKSIVAVSEHGREACGFTVGVDESGMFLRVREEFEDFADKNLPVVFDNQTADPVEVSAVVTGAVSMQLKCNPWLSLFSFSNPGSGGVIRFFVSDRSDSAPCDAKQTGGTEQADIVFP